MHTAVADALAGLGFEVLFGVVGDGNMLVLDDLVGRHGVRYVPAAHEAGAVLMADGYARASGLPSLVTVTHGPGLTNATTAVVEAVRSRTPMVVVTGSAPRSVMHLQAFDLRGFSTLTGAAYVAVRTPQSAAPDLATAYRLAISGRGPVIYDIAADLLKEDASGAAIAGDLAAVAPLVAEAPDLRAAVRPLTVASDEALDRALGIAITARRPLIVAGWGAVEAGAGPILAALAQRIGGLVATTLRARGLFAGEAYNLDVVGSVATEAAADLSAQADAILAFGASLNGFTTAGGALLEGKALVHCDNRPEVPGSRCSPDVVLHGDAKLVAETMVERLEGVLTSGVWRRNEVVAPLRRTESVMVPSEGHVPPGTVDPRVLLPRLCAQLPVGSRIVTDSGYACIASWRLLQTSGPRTFFTTVAFGSVGLALATAIGVAVHEPSRPTIAIVGDGAWAMSLQELTVAVEQRAHLLVLVLDDGGYGAEFAKLTDYGRPVGIAKFPSPGAHKVGSAMGALGMDLHEAAEIDTAIAALSEGPVVVRVAVDPTLVASLV